MNYLTSKGNIPAMCRIPDALLLCPDFKGILYQMPYLVYIILTDYGYTFSLLYSTYEGAAG